MPSQTHSMHLTILTLRCPAVLPKGGICKTILLVFRSGAFPAPAEDHPVSTGSRTKPNPGTKRWPSLSVLAGGALLAYSVPLSGMRVKAEELPSNLLPFESSTMPQSKMPTSHYNLNATNLSSAQQEFELLLGAERVITDKGELVAKSSTDWSAAPHGEADRASMIVLPKSTEEVSAIIKICHRRRLPIIAFSGVTSRGHVGHDDGRRHVH
jgi:hypothetical protein